MHSGESTCPELVERYVYLGTLELLRVTPFFVTIELFEYTVVLLQRVIKNHTQNLFALIVCVCSDAKCTWKGRQSFQATILIFKPVHALRIFCIWSKFPANEMSDLEQVQGTPALSSS